MSQVLVVAKKYLSERCVSDKYHSRVLRVAAGCRSFSEERCNQYLRKRLREVSSVTVAPERSSILTLWTFAYERGLVERLPRGIVKVRVSRQPIRAWTLEQCCTAVKRTFSLDHKPMRSGAFLGVFLRCWLLLGYESGARMSDLWEFHEDNFTDGAVSWTQSKTGVAHVKALSRPCMREVQAMLARSPDGRVLGWSMSQIGARKRLRSYLKSIGLSGSGKWLRRSGATHIEIMQPGKARVHLGHKTSGMAERHYIDWSQVRRDIPCAPLLLEQ